MLQVITNDGSAPHQLDTTGTVKHLSLGMPLVAWSTYLKQSSMTASIIIPASPSFRMAMSSTYFSFSHRTRIFRSKSTCTGWVLHLQSFQALVRRSCDVKVYLRAGILKAQSCIYQTLQSLKKKWTATSTTTTTTSREWTLRKRFASMSTSVPSASSPSSSDSPELEKIENPYPVCQ